MMMMMMTMLKQTELAPFEPLGRLHDDDNDNNDGDDDDDDENWHLLSHKEA